MRLVEDLGLLDHQLSYVRFGRRIAASAGIGRRLANDRVVKLRLGLVRLVVGPDGAGRCMGG